MATTGSSSSLESPDVQARAAGLVVGMATCNHAGTAGTVARDVCAALARHGRPMRWSLVVADGGSTDGTIDRIRAGAGSAEVVEVSYPRHPSDALVMPYHAMAGRARALQALLHEAQVRRAAACIVIDAAATGATQEAVARMLAALESDEVDFVGPAYARHPLNGALVQGVLYPLFRALYGVRLRWPLGLDFGCSARLVDALLPEAVWDTDAGQIGIDLWLATSAAAGGFHVAEAVVERRQTPERRGLDLSTTLAQVVGWFFTDMTRRAAVWQRVRASRAVPRFGEVHGPVEAPTVDPEALVHAFRLGQRELEDVWAEVLPPVAILQWRRLAGAPLAAFRVDDALWARTVYDFAMGHRLRVIARDHLLKSLTPLYLAWLASLVQEVRALPPDEADGPIERLCVAFEKEKPSLISQWRWPERFRPVKLRR